MAKKTCRDCKKEFEVIGFSRYPRKFCKKCSAKRKKAWDNQWKVKFDDKNLED